MHKSDKAQYSTVYTVLYLYIAFIVVGNRFPKRQQKQGEIRANVRSHLVSTNNLDGSKALYKAEVTVHIVRQVCGGSV